MSIKRLNLLVITVVLSTLTSLSQSSTSVDSTGKTPVFKPYIELNPKPPHPLWRPLQSLVKREIKIDSTGKYVTIIEKIAGFSNKIAITLPLEEYIKLKLKQTEKKTLSELARKTTRSNRKKDQLEEFFGSITNIQIPVPANPILSIFGPPVINLHISGAVDLTGAWRNEKTEQIIASRYGNVRNEPNFNQQVQINVGGTIGDKLRITADWDTKRQFEYENNLKLKYTGYSDEIIKSIEAGNVSLQTPSSLIGGSQRLFGIKANLQIGPLKLTTIASQKKSESKEETISGGAKSKEREIYAYQFSQKHYFIDEKYIPLFEPYYQNRPPQYVKPELKIKDIEVWVTQLGLVDPNSREAIAVIDLPPKNESTKDYYERLRTDISIQEKPGEIEIGRFIKLEEGKDYTVNFDVGFISLKRSIQENQAIAVAYRIEGPTASADDDTVYGDFFNTVTDTATRLVLKLVKPKYLQPGFKKAWKLQLRNFYPIGGTGVKKEGFELQILYQVPGQEPRDEIEGFNLLQVFGFDKTDENGTGPPDGKFDFLSGITIDPSTGEIIFPYLEPFREAFLKFKDPKTGKGISNPDSFIYSDIYDTTLAEAMKNTSRANRFIIKAKFVSEVSQVIDLGFNIAEGSVQVLLGGQPLKEGTDYKVDYVLGRVTILKPEALVPGADLKIKYERNDIFQLASKNVLGLRGDMNISKNSRFGFTVMNYSQQSLSDKVRLGEEPISNTILGADLSIQQKMKISKFFNFLPGYEATQDATFTLKGESAIIFPDPNTRKSTIPGDNKKSVVYLDDFEGSKRTISIGTQMAPWGFASPPAIMPNLGEEKPFQIPAQTKAEYRAKLIWYNYQSSVHVNEIWPEKRTAQTDQFITPLDINFRPTQRGQFNYTTKWDSIKNYPTSTWAGIMRVIPSYSTDLTRENITYIEIWFKIIGDPGPNAKMLIDLGQISEDAIPNNVLDTEDKNKDGVLQPEEDVGLDGIPDEKERELYPYLGDDPSQDDFSYITGSTNFENINGSEGNREFYRYPNTEDLNNNYNLDRANSYFEYEIPLDTVNNPYISGGGFNGWYQLKIPLSSYIRTVGQPSFTLVEFIRLWFTGFENQALIRIAKFDLVGNYWEEAFKNDDRFTVTVVNIEDNPEYTIPPGVVRPRDRTRPEQQVLLNEQSLAFKIKDFPDGLVRYAQRRFPKKIDLFNYRIMKLFVHGDTKNFYFKDTTDYSAEIFIWFGSDTSNYYEYRQPIWPGWHKNNNIQIVFSQLTALKQTRDSAKAPIKRVPVPGGPPGATYWVKGNPTLTNVNFIAIGIINPKGKGPEVISGDVWVNELRLIQADDASGWAYRFSTQFSIPNLISTAFNISKQSPNFHRVEQRFSKTRATLTNWSLRTTFNIEKLLPKFISNALKIPLTYIRSERLMVPKYLPGTDILAKEAAKRLKQSLIEKGVPEKIANRKADSLLTVVQRVQVSESWAVPSVGLNINSKKWYVKNFINRIKFGVNFSRSSYRDVNVEYQRQWSFNTKLDFSTNFKPPTIKPFSKIFSKIPILKAYKDWQINITPSSISASMRFNRNQRRRKIRTKTVPEPVTRIFNAQRGFSFDWRLTNNGLINPSLRYTANITSNLVHLETDSTGRQRTTAEILKDIFFNKRLIYFGRTGNFNQQINIGTNPKIPPVLGLDRYLNINASYSVNYRWQNNFQNKNLGRSSAYTANLNFSLSFRLKQLADQLFKSKPTRRIIRRGRGRRIERRKQTTKQNKSKKKKTSIKDILKVLIKIPFLDYDNIRVTYTQTNSSQNTGLYSHNPGMGNFWGALAFQKSRLEYGPSLMYQLGLVSDPNGKVKFKKKNSFPFFGFDLIPGLRAPNGNLVDIYQQTNKITISTSRPLWRGATLTLNWNINWAYSRNQSIITDSTGNPTVVSRTATGNLGRSFFTLPSVFIFKIFQTGINKVASKYAEFKLDPKDKRSDNEKLAQAFEEGLEALPVLNKILGIYLPRVNWKLRWSGLERIAPFKSFATRVSLDHSYTSSLQKRWKVIPGQGTIFESERINYAFSPLLSLNITFKSVWNGSMRGNIRINSSTTYDLNLSAKTIVESGTKEISFNLSFSKRGFNIPMFGLSLKNDVDISLTYSYSRNFRKRYSVTELATGQGNILDGMLRQMLEFRFRYVLSSKVTGSLFYRLTKTKPDARGSYIAGSTVNEVGIDLHISIGA